MAERGREIPDRWRDRFNYWIGQLELSWLAFEKMGGGDRHRSKMIAEGKVTRTAPRILYRMSNTLPIEREDKQELLALVGQGVPRDFAAISVSWRDAFGTFGYHADRMLHRILRTQPEHQAVSEIGLPYIESLAQRVRILGPQNLT